MGTVHLHFFEEGGDYFPFEMHAVLFHVGADELRAFSIEASEKDATDGDGDVVPKPFEEAGAFEADVGGAHAQYLTGVGFECEYVIGGDGEFGSGAGEGGGPTPRGDDKTGGGKGALIAFFVSQFQSMRIDKPAEFVEVRHVLLA